MNKNSDGKVNNEQCQDSTNQCHPQLLPPKDLGIDLVKKLSKKRKAKAFHWGPVEQQKYIKFLVDQRGLFELNSDRRRVVGVHVKMSKTIRNRSAIQCRSHHQKMLMKYGNIDNIILCNKHLLLQRTLQKKVSPRLQAPIIQEKELKTALQLQDLLILEPFAQRSVECNQNIFFESELKEFQSEQFNVSQFYDIY